MGLRNQLQSKAGRLDVIPRTSMCGKLQKATKEKPMFQHLRDSLKTNPCGLNSSDGPAVVCIPGSPGVFPLPPEPRVPRHSQPNDPKVGRLDRNDHPKQFLGFSPGSFALPAAARRPEAKRR